MQPGGIHFIGLVNGFHRWFDCGHARRRRHDAVGKVIVDKLEVAQPLFDDAMSLG